MPCFKPLTAWRGLVSPKTGKRSVVFKAGASTPGLSAFPQKLPCSQCIGCRLDYSYDWAVRCVCEAKMHRDNCLILLTYERIPKDGSLQLDDWQNFMKALRRAVGPVRHFHAGEYGTKNGRPHDHALLFGYDFPDKQFLKFSSTGHRLYTSMQLSSLWKKGHATVAGMSFESAGYLARYLMEKPTLTKQVKDENGIVIGRTYTDRAIEKYGEVVNKLNGEIKLAKRPEYLTMSRRPGIGKLWFDKYWGDVYPKDYVQIEGRKMPPPRYFDNELEKIEPGMLNNIKMKRLSRCNKKEEVWNKFLEKYQLLDVARDDRLNVMEEVKEAQLRLYNNERGALI